MNHAHPTQLLPWYVNGTLKQAEQQRVQAHLDKCPQCKSEVLSLQQLQACTKQHWKAPYSPGALGLARIRRLAQKSVRRGPLRWIKPAIAMAAAVVIMVQAGMLLHQHRSSGESGLQLMSSTSKGDIQVRFSPSATNIQITSLLQSIRASVVDGPGALGIYHIKIKTDHLTEHSIKLAVHRLQAHPEIVLFAASE